MPCCGEFCAWLAHSLDQGSEDEDRDLRISRGIPDTDTTDDASNGQHGSRSGIKILKQGKAMPKKKVQLYNRHGYNLAIFPGGKVSQLARKIHMLNKNHVTSNNVCFIKIMPIFQKGVRHAFSPYAVLELITVGVGEIRIQGLETGLYLKMTDRGKLEGSEDASLEDTIFVERIIQGKYISYLSRRYAYQGYHIGIKKNGKIKEKMDVYSNQNLFFSHFFKEKNANFLLAICFLHRAPHPDPHPLKQIVNKYGFKLSILPSGDIQGIKDEFSKYAVLEFSPGPDIGTVRLKGVESNLYVAMNSDGRLYGEADASNLGTIFEQNSRKKYFTLLSYRYSHMGWHLGIKQSGEVKTGYTTVFKSRQKAIEWQAIQPYPSPISIEFVPKWPDFPFIDDDVPEEKD